MNSHRLLYLHGFNSSPQSSKAQLLRVYMDERGMSDQLVIPALPPVPAEAMSQLISWFEANQKEATIAVAGSSLGGFYATHLAERFGCKTVLINPAVRPHVLLKKYLGDNTNYHTDESWVLNESHIEQFRTLNVASISHPERYLLLLQTGDETLDYRQALEKYQGCQLVLEEGGDHSFSGFKNHIAQILKFCGIDE